jgi:hypothetical protein
LVNQPFSTISSDMQYLASAADVVTNFEPDTAADTQQHLDTFDPLLHQAPLILLQLLTPGILIFVIVYRQLS